MCRGWKGFFGVGNCLSEPLIEAGYSDFTEMYKPVVPLGQIIYYLIIYYKPVVPLGQYPIF